MTLSDADRRLRDEPATELGFHPASLDDNIQRHRVGAAADKAPSLERLHAKYAHFREEKRRAEAEAAARAAVADLGK